MTNPRPAPPPLADLLQQGAAALFLDFDGTLVNIAATPDAIEVPGGLAAALESLAGRHAGAVAVVTGRALDNLAEHVGTLRIATAGSHGAEVLGASGERIGGQPMALSDDVRSAIERFAAQHEGVSVEYKSFGLALHFRADPAAEQRVRAFAGDLAAEHGLQLKRGKSVCELMQSGGGKDRAVAVLMDTAPFAGTNPVFIGDDVTDEDGFAEVIRRGGTAIVVGDRPDSGAQFGLADPAAVRDWLGL